MDKALLIIDYSYDFVADDGKLTCGKPGQSIDQAIARKFEAYLTEGNPVFIMMDLHDLNDMSHPESKLFPPHNIRGTEGRELYGAVKKFMKSSGIVLLSSGLTRDAIAHLRAHRFISI